MDTVTKRDWNIFNNVDFFLETLSHKRLQHTSIRTRQVSEHFLPWPFCLPWFFWWPWCPESLAGWWFPGTQSNPRQPSASFYTPWYMYHVAVNRWIIYIQWHLVKGPINDEQIIDMDGFICISIIFFLIIPNRSVFSGIYKQVLHIMGGLKVPGITTISSLLEILWKMFSDLKLYHAVQLMGT